MMLSKLFHLNSICVVLTLPILFASCEWNRLREARALYDEGKYEEALEKYQRSLAGNPHSAIVNFNMGVVLYRVGDYEKSIEYSSKVLAAGSPDLKTETNYNIGNCKFRLGEQKEKVDLARSVELYNEARDYYKKAIDLDEKEEDGKYNLQYVGKRLGALSARLRDRGLERRGGTKDAGTGFPPGEPDHRTRSEGTDESKGMETEAGEMSKETAELLLEQYGSDKMGTPGSVRKPKGQAFETDKDW